MLCYAGSLIVSSALRGPGVLCIKEGGVDNVASSYGVREWAGSLGLLCNSALLWLREKAIGRCQGLARL